MSSYINAYEHSKFLGANFTNRQAEIVLRIGGKQWTRTQLVQQIGIGNMSAAARLTTVLRKSGVNSIDKLYTIDPRELALVRGLGETVIFVAMAVLASEGFDVKVWYGRSEGLRKRVVTFRTMKIHRGRRGRRS